MPKPSHWSIESSRAPPDRLAPVFRIYRALWDSIRGSVQRLPGRRSFTELVRRYTSDVPAEEMLDELKRSERCSTLETAYRVLTRSYIPSAADPAKFHAMSVAFTDLAKTLDQNLRPDEDQKIFERRVWAPNGITPNDALDFDIYVKDRGQQFLESLDDWLSTRETAAARNGADQRVKVGVAMYMFVRPIDDQSVEDSIQ